MTLRGADPRWPFLLSSLVLLLTSLGLARVERRLAAQPAAARPAEAPRRSGAGAPLPQRVSVFMLVVVVLGIGFQIHGNLNSAPQFLRFAKTGRSRPPDADLLDRLQRRDVFRRAC
ncbi:MAG: hypothetical protein WDO24_03225 [Pseudomonadota bacterium]